MAEHVDRFVQELAPAARAIGAEYGIDPALIITQAAIESGWGQKVAGNNYFGVKSHGQPGGQSVMTHEEVNGQLVPMYQDFRKYDSLEESMRDYAKFLKDNPRYSGVFEAPDLQGQIDAIAGSGYATSSKYPGLLNDVSRMVTRAMPAGDAPAMGYAPTPAPRSQNPALGAITQALLPDLGPPGTKSNGIGAMPKFGDLAMRGGIMRPAAAQPKGGGLLTAAVGGLGNLLGYAGQQTAPIMRGAQTAGQNAMPSIMKAALGSVAARTALIDPAIKNIMTGNRSGALGTPPPATGVGSRGYTTIMAPGGARKLDNANGVFVGAPVMYGSGGFSGSGSSGGAHGGSENDKNRGENQWSNGRRY